MKKIKVYVNYRDEDKTHFYEYFKIVEELPKIENNKKYNDEVVEIKEIQPDVENNNDVFDYNYYEIKYIDYQYFNEEDNDNIEDYTHYEYIAIPKNESED